MEPHQLAADLLSNSLVSTHSFFFLFEIHNFMRSDLHIVKERQNEIIGTNVYTLGQLGRLL